MDSEVKKVRKPRAKKAAPVVAEPEVQPGLNRQQFRAQQRQFKKQQKKGIVVEHVYRDGKQGWRIKFGGVYLRASKAPHAGEVAFFKSEQDARTALTTQFQIIRDEINAAIKKSNE